MQNINTRQETPILAQVCGLALQRRVLVPSLTEINFRRHNANTHYQRCILYASFRSVHALLE